MKMIVKHLIPSVGTLVIVSLLFLAQSVGALPNTAPAELLAPSQTVISYQGTLTDPDGNPLDQVVTMEFSLYDAATNGNHLWGPETQSVQVSNGLFHVLLGSVTPINPDDFSGDLYLNTKVNGEMLSPREMLSSVVHAIDASTLPHLAVTRGDLSVDGVLSVLEPGSSTGKVGISSPASQPGIIFYSNQPEGYRADVRRYSDRFAISLGETTGIPAEALTVYNAGSAKIRGDFTVAGGDLRFGNNESALRHDGSRTLHLLPWGGSGHAWDNVCIGCGSDAGLIIRGNVSCGGLTEANLQTEEELAAERIDRFEEGDVLCWGDGQLEKCAQACDPLVQAVADADGRPIVIGAELVKVVGPVKKGDFLVASDVPGYAMATQSPAFGTVIAQALEDFDGEQGIIKAMIRKM
jgi:hypothetical protein